MGHVIALAMQKGGVGKTTTALSLGVALAERGRRVLLIDIDPQANLTQGLGIDPSELEYSVYEVLLNPEQGAAFATRPTDAGVDLVPASLALPGAEPGDLLAQRAGRRRRGAGAAAAARLRAEGHAAAGGHDRAGDRDQPWA